ncbi:UNVERIFIED_CONTAM: hypothetical protein PYX00_000989 [Menopon gallinae]|uniref:Trafficking protein particle complex subunit 8 n=1 Tax=Menopon gallinae TaxID=328185 RepID=A0AAW2ICE3_9NEOP
MYTHPTSFVQRTFPPMIGCITSPNVEQICRKNNLTFAEMLRPFCIVNVGHRLRDPSANDHLIKILQICIQDVNDIPPQPSLAKKFLNESVSGASCEVTKAVVVNNLTLDIPTECKWFHSWSKTFLSVQYPSDHEFTKHLLGCILVTSAVDPPETLQLLLQSLQQMQAVTPSKIPKWFSQNIFKFYVVVHDVREGDREKAIAFFNSLKSAYGPDHCFFLEINSQQPQPAASTVIHDYWTEYVTRTQELDGSEHGSSPRTPAEIANSLGGMPTCVINESDGSIRSGGSPEMAQEAGEMQQSVVIHPLSPDIEVAPVNVSSNQMQTSDINRVVNSDVWSGLQGSGMQHGNLLTPNDIKNIRSLIKQLIVQVLIPHVEKQIYHLNDQASNKKGVSRSLFTATKRLFSTSKPGSVGAPYNSVVYANDAPELQLRRLGDLYFMFTNYGLAFQAYHSVKRDFAADQAYIYLAGALEMAALSAFMQGDTGRKAVDYMEEAILTYLNSCKLPQFATRATLLSTQFLRERQLYGEAAKQLIRMTSEDSDLRSALLLEQASYCFLYSNRPNMSRKYAFHMVLAGHRFSKAGQRKHALRCYKQAYQVYQEKGWNLAEDHIHYTIGRLAGHLKLLKEGSQSLSSLLSSGNKQTPTQQVTYLREYLHMLHQLNTEEPSTDLNILPLPTVEDNSARVLASASPTTNLMLAFEPDSPADSSVWAKMEELAVTESLGPPMIFRPTIQLFSKNTNNIVNPVVVANETVHVQVMLRNPLQITLLLLRVKLLWEFHKQDGEVISNSTEKEECDTYVDSRVVESISLPPYASQQIVLSLVPLVSGQVNIVGMSYTLTCPAANGVQNTDVPAVRGKQLFAVRGPKIRPKKDQTEVAYEKDNRLNIKIIDALPLLQVDMENFKMDMLSGQIEKTVIKLKNTGNAPLKNLYLVTSSSQLFSISSKCVVSDKIIVEQPPDGGPEYGEIFKEKVRTYKIMQILLSSNGILNAGEEISLPLWIRAPDQEGVTRIKMLFYYENGLDNSTPKYRVTRFSQDISVRVSLQLSAIVHRSNLHEDKDTMNIAVTVKNLNENGDLLGAVTIYLVQISLATAKWELQPKAVYSKDLKLVSQESYSFIARASRSNNEEKEITDVCLQDTVVEPGTVQPYYDFYKWHIYHEKDDVPDNLYKMVLCLRWQGNITCGSEPAKFVNGLSHVTLTDLAVPCIWPEDKNALLPKDQVETLKIFGPDRRSNLSRRLPRRIQLENALSYSLIHDHYIYHSFQERRYGKEKLSGKVED